MKKCRSLLEIIIVIITLLNTNCQSRKGYEIIGHINNTEDSTLVALYDFEQQITIDSAYTLN